MFEGDGYSDDWAKEAKKRGLNNLKQLRKLLSRKWIKNS
jgi:glutamine synthetase